MNDELTKLVNIVGGQVGSVCDALEKAARPDSTTALFHSATKFSPFQLLLWFQSFAPLNLFPLPTNKKTNPGSKKKSEVVLKLYEQVRKNIEHKTQCTRIK